jgi:hypothetical protein
VLVHVSVTMTCILPNPCKLHFVVSCQHALLLQLTSNMGGSVAYCYGSRKLCFSQMFVFVRTLRQYMWGLLNV